MRLSYNLENKISLDTYRKIHKFRSQFFRTTTKIQSESDAFEELRSDLTFFTIFGVIEILCSFRLVLEEKAGKDIKDVSRGF